MLLSVLLWLACTASVPVGEPPSIRADADLHPELKAHGERLAKQAVLEPAEGVYVATGYALANVIAIEGSDGLVIVDTTESRTSAREALAALRAYTDKPIAAVVLTHNHADHVFGGTEFVGDQDIPVYAHAATEAGIDRVVNVLRDAIQVRSFRMFGVLLPDHATSGIGLHLRFDPSDMGLVRPTHTFEDRLEVHHGGVHMELVHAPGETDDQLFVWLPERKILLPADNVYQAFPNLYTIRGTPYRDVRQWVDSLDAMRDLEPEVLVPQHTHPVVGKEDVADVLTAYRDAIQYVHDQTIRGINQGRTPDELAASVRLPPHLESHPWLREHYGRVPWSVRSIYAGNLGWYDGRGATLEPLPPAERAQRYRDAFAAGRSLEAQARAAVEAGDASWGAELAQLWLDAEPDSSEARTVLADALDALARGHINPNARSWYLTEALELRGDIVNVATPPSRPPTSFIDGLPVESFLRGLATRLRAEEVLDTDLVLQLTFTDLQEQWTVHVRRGIAEVRPVPPRRPPDLALTTTSTAFKRLLAGKERLEQLDALQLDRGGVLEWARFLSWFRP